MSVLLADIDATCAALGYNDGDKYHVEPDALQGLKHLIWILRRDLDNHEYRRHLGRAKVLQTDLISMLSTFIDDDEYSDVLIRLLVILTNPTLLLYRDGIPKDNQGRKIYLELIEILQGYKEGFTSNLIWASLSKKLQDVLNVDWSLRGEEQGLVIERILVLTRNVLQVPANPEAECRPDNDASLHDQIIWALNQSGMLDLSLYILSSADENQYHLHALEILCLLYREQTATSLADASMQRSAVEKQRDDQELLVARRREHKKLVAKPPPGRHSRFGGTYVVKNFKSVSDKDIICHQSLERATAIDFDHEKVKQKRSHRIIKEEMPSERRSAFSVRLCLREFCIEVLQSAYNNLVRQVRRVLERNTGSACRDDSYLLWAIKFFMEFNRLSCNQLNLVSESLSIQCFHWILTRIHHNMDMINSDKKEARIWARRLHVAIQAFRELLLSLIAVQKSTDEKAQRLFDMLLNNICYVSEYRETILHLFINYNETHSTKAYLRDVTETVNIFIKIMEKFCKDSVVVQEKRRNVKKSTKKINENKKKVKETSSLELEQKWNEFSLEIANLLIPGNISLPEDKHPIPFDGASDRSIDDQKEDCMLRIYKYLREGNWQFAIILLRAGREVWPEQDSFGATNSSPEDELLVLREIFMANLGEIQNQSIETDESESENDLSEEESPNVIEKNFKFEDLTKRLVNPKIVRACTIVLNDWEKIETKILKAAVTLLHRIAFGCCCPAMLFNASLFLIFQQVFDRPRESHQEELRRLGIFVVRKFIEIAPKNSKIYAELLFYKTIREANELENGYSESENSVKTKGAWTEEQEDELIRLFEENQSNPQNDNDVIDWILENLIEKTRTRRGVLKKMKEMDLIFKAPTRKPSAGVAKKILWHHDDDEQLRNLYNETRLEENCLDKICESFNEKFSKQDIIKRMIQLYLIADKSEIMPAKSNQKINKKSNLISKNKTNQNKNNTKKKLQERRKVKSSLDTGIIRTLKIQLETDFQEALDWLKDSIEDAATEDVEEDTQDEDDGVPLVPLLENQSNAVENSDFQKLLICLGLQPPIQETEIYWRIPIHLTKDDLNLRVNILNGNYIEEEKIIEKSNNDENVDFYENNSSDSDKNDLNIDSDEGEIDFLDNLISKRRQHVENLVFNESDDENKTIQLHDRKSAFDELKEKNAEKKIKNTKKSVNENKLSLVPNNDSDNENLIDSQNLRLRLAELSDSDDGSEKFVKKTNRVRRVLDSDSEDDNNSTKVNEETLSENHLSMKRQRNDESDDNNLGADEVNTKIEKKTKKLKRIIFDDDDD